MSDVAGLRAHLSTYGRSLLGYSGGVDSAVLAVACRLELGDRGFLAVIGRSDSYPASQYEGAVSIAGTFDIPLLEVSTREMEDPNYVSNPANRCYFCKSELWRRLGEVALERGFETILDGTNADDLREHRPGARAAGEQQVRSPFVELGWTKAMVRDAARELGIPIWDAPAQPCLSSRVEYGLSITPERLRQVERGEAFLRSLGIRGDLRVRHHGPRARLEVTPSDMSGLEERWVEVEHFFSGLGFESVELDPLGYRRGSLLLTLPVLDR
ncbi:MAG: ATP-dependent sacrificial sulfur transferase LarE [Gemmatimonadota bacterium]